MPLFNKNRKSLHKEHINQSANNEIKMWFDSYDDLFSDFDSNPYSTRVLSDDFIFQLKKVTRHHLQRISH